MKLKGILDFSLGNFLCLRGFASMGDLYDNSEADPSYQRDLLKEHEKEMVAFLRDGEFLFFPEVILATTLSPDEADSEPVQKLFENIQAGKAFMGLKFTDCRIGCVVQKSKSSTEARVLEFFRTGTIDFNEPLTRKLSRIDGNHRLSATPKDAKFRKHNTPFCLLLFRNKAEAAKFSRALFHNINYKSIPLTMEQNLKLILDDERLFPDEKLKKHEFFGWPYLLARKALPSIEPKAVPALKSVLKHPRAMLLELFRLLIERKAMPASASKLPDVQRCLAEVHHIYEQDDDLQKNECVGLLEAFVFFCLTDPKRAMFKPFQQWVKGNHLAAMTQTDAHALIEIFERVHTAKARTVFISMEFGAKTEATFKTIKRAIDRINEKCRPKIKIQPLRIDELIKGHSYTISDEILKAIENSGLLIADLTFGNKNVYHEIGYLMGLNRARTGAQENFILIVRNQDAEQVEKDVAFNLKGVSQIRFREMNDLEDELTVRIKEYYGLV